MTDELDCGLQPAANIFDVLPIERADPICTRTPTARGEIVRFIKAPEKRDAPDFCADHPALAWHKYLASMFFWAPAGECNRAWWIARKPFSTKPGKDDLAAIYGDDGGAE